MFSPSKIKVKYFRQFRKANQHGQCSDREGQGAD